MGLKVPISWNIKKNLRYMIVLFIFFYAIPFFIVNLPQFPQADPKNWTVEGGFIAARICLIGIWIAVPFSGGAVALWHVLANEQFCPILIMEAALAMFLYLFWIEASLVIVLSLSVFIVLLMESFTLLEFCKPPAKGKKFSLLAGAARNRKFLSLLCFWSVGIIVVIQIACRYTALWGEVVSPIILLPLPIILFVLPLFRLKDSPLSAGGMVGVLLLFSFSALLSTTFYMNRFWKAHLIFLTIGYGMLLLMECLIALIKLVHIKLTTSKE